MKKIRLYFRWLLGYWFDLCPFECKFSDTCKYCGSFRCGSCDQCIFDKCGHCVNRDSCGFVHRQKFAREEDWR